MTEDQSTILIVEDDLDVADMLNAYFNVQGYDVLTANWGEDAIKMCQDAPPDLIILDIRLPDIDGFEVARRLRHNRRTQNIPIIFLTEKRARADRLQGLELGADDYITKPFDVQELRLRVRNALSRATLNTVTNPVTNLPEGSLVEDRLGDCIKKEDWAILLISLDNLEKFRDTYGFVASDDVLRAVSLMINNAVRDVGNPSDFVGQYSNAEFILVTTPSLLPILTERINTRLEQSLDYFYPLKDRGRPEIQDKRIALRVYQIDSSKGPFRSVQALKIELLKNRL